MLYKFNLSADYFQFYLQDEQSNGNLSHSRTEEALYNMLAIAPGVVGVGWVRNMNVPVEVKVLDLQPDNNFEAWNHVTEASVAVLSRQIVIAGCTDYFPDAARITVEPGTYRVRVYYGGLDSVDVWKLDGDDHYKVVLWLNADIAETKVLKRWKAA